MYCMECGNEIATEAMFCNKCGARQVIVNPLQDVQEKNYPSRQQNIENTEFNYSGFWRRFVALIIDSVILAIVGAIIGGVLGAIIGFILGFNGVDIPTIKTITSVVGGMAGLVLNWIYFTAYESSSKQATLGKRMMGMYVTDINGQRITFAKANGRYFGKILSGLLVCIGFVMAGFTKKKQGLHDIMASTLVIQRN